MTLHNASAATSTPTNAWNFSFHTLTGHNPLPLESFRGKVLLIVNTASKCGVTFPMTSKEVVSGKNAHPFYLWARQQAGFGSAPKWNFHKYLINRKGELITYFYSTTAPDAPRLVKAIQKALAEKE